MNRSILALVGLLLTVGVLAVPVSRADDDVTRATVSLPREKTPSADAVMTLDMDREAMRELGRDGVPARLDVPLPGRDAVEVELEPFSIVDRSTVFARGRRGGDEVLPFDPSSVVLLRGHATGYADSRVFIAIGRRMVMGSIDLGPGEVRYSMTGGADPAVSITEDTGVSFPPLGVDVCGVGPAEAPVAPLGGPAGDPADDFTPGLRWLKLAIDTDYEFYLLFGDEVEATEYIIALWGAISDIYLRDIDIYITVPFIRIWDESDDLFNEPDPLVPFKNYWNDNMGGVDRDTAMLLTGRRDLPYGGVAYLSALCTDFGYAVSGYMLGSFANATQPDFGNWDITVCAHELGHNCGTRHTHDYGIDACASGAVQRGTIMSYCHTTPGGVANVDPRFHTFVQRVVETFVADTCLFLDCNLDGVNDGVDAESEDVNDNGVLDQCEDCNGNGTIDEQDIEFGFSTDVNFNGVPDECEPDCNGNGVPDDRDITTFISTDLYGNGIPDECEADCNGNGMSDYNEIQLDMSKDIDRNAVLDECQDCDGNGIGDLVDLGGALNVWVASDTLDELREVHAKTGVYVRSSDALAEVGDVRDLIFTPDDHILVSSAANHGIAEYDRVTGAFRRWFVTPNAGGLLFPSGMTFGPNGNLFVASSGNNLVLEFDGTTGAFVSLFAGEVGGPGGIGDTDPYIPFGVTFGPDGDLFVSTGDNKVLRYNGETGDEIGAFVSPSLGGLDTPRGLVFKPDGNLLVASGGSNAILEYDGNSGAFVGRFDLGGVVTGFWGLREPWCLRIGPFGEQLYVSVHDGSASIHTYELETGQFMRSYYILAQVIDDATGFDFAPASELDCNRNLRLDTCDIADGILRDINFDGWPDDCALPACIGDVSGDDGVVDVVDLVGLLGAWGTDDPQYDIFPIGSGDGIVGVADMLLLLGGWGPCE